MIHGFESIFGGAKHVHIVVSEEAKTYRPEMEWLAGQIKHSELKIQNPEFTDFKEGDAVYRFFELFDLKNVASANKIFELAAGKKIKLTPPPKPIFEEKMLFALVVEPQPPTFLAAGTGRRFSGAAEKNHSRTPGWLTRRHCRRTRRFPN